MPAYSTTLNPLNPNNSGTGQQPSLPQTYIKSFDIDSLLQARINFLYNLEPAQDNMFICSPIVSNGDSASIVGYPLTTPIIGETENPIALPAQTFQTASYRLYSAKFSLPKIKTEQFARIRKNMITGIEMNQTFTLEWIEDCFHSVRKYHHDWFNCWYYRESDSFKTGKTTGRYRSFHIYMYHIAHNNEQIVPHVWGVIDIRDAFPIDLGDITLSADSGNSIYSCQYMANFIDLRFSDTTSDSTAYLNRYNTLKNMGFSEVEIGRLKAAFTIRNGEGGENFLF